MNLKELKNKAEELFAQGMNKEEIFKKLKNEAPGENTITLSLIAADLLPAEVKLKYRIWVVILSLLLTGSILVWMFNPSPFVGNTKYLTYMISLLFISFIIIGLHNYVSSYFSSVFFVALPITLFLGAKVSTGAGESYSYLLLFPIATGGLALWLKMKLFPLVGFFGRVRKDKAGNYIFK